MTDYISKINDYTIGGDDFDGERWEWKDASDVIVKSTSLTKETYTTYNISSKLPDDDYDYEIIVCAAWNNPGNENKICQLTVFPGTVTSSTSTGHGWRLDKCVIRNGDWDTKGGGSCLIPIDSNDRNITIWTQEATQSATACDLWISAYRRLGKKRIAQSQPIDNVSINEDNYNIGGEQFDGALCFKSPQNDSVWLSNNDLATGSLRSGRTLELSIPDTFLPFGSKYYEVQLSVDTYSNKSSDAKFLSFYACAHDQSRYHAICTTRIKPRTNAVYGKKYCFWLPLTNIVKGIEFKNTGDATNYYKITMETYRRMGYNYTQNLYAWSSPPSTLILFSKMDYPQENAPIFARASLNNNIIREDGYMQDVDADGFIYVGSKYTRSPENDILMVKGITLNGTEHKFNGTNVDGDWEILTTPVELFNGSIAANSWSYIQLPSSLYNKDYDIMASFEGVLSSLASGGSPKLDSRIFTQDSNSQTYTVRTSYTPLMRTEMHGDKAYYMATNVMYPIPKHSTHLGLCNTDSKATGNITLHHIANRRVGTNE